MANPKKVALRKARLAAERAPSGIQVIEPKTRVDHRQFAPVAHGIQVLTGGRQKTVETVEQELIANAPPPSDPTHVRVQYSTMKARQELAATALSTGASVRMAAAMAGVSNSTVRKYIESRDFRDRVEELRQLIMGEIHGRITEEFKRRTEPEAIKKLEIMDLVRVFDRASGQGGMRGMNGAASAIKDAEGVQKYDIVINALVSPTPIQNPNSREESTDFPDYEDENLLLSAGDSPID